MSVSIELDTTQFLSAIKQYLKGTGREMDSAVREMTYRVRTRLRAYTPVDTGRLVGSWRGPKKRLGAGGTLSGYAIPDAVEYAVTTSVPYATTVEYGGYRGVGPRTIELGGRSLGQDFQAEPGIYSLQAPHGMVRKALADEARNLKFLNQALAKNWGK